MPTKRARPKVTKDRVWASFSRLADICHKPTEYVVFEKDKNNKNVARLIPKAWHLSYESMYGGYTITANDEKGEFEIQFLRLPRLNPSTMYFALEFAIGLLDHLERTGEIVWTKKKE